ncbi:universal stress protein [Beijerinckia sp. L45]|uniref:universal stress protein n=1 Tax=Beijerinckia sp. L45 TaxID=1641855 RepID=UPI00131C7CF1|nr:universal stress protein [Beijerinckia sp. L45]
MKSILVPVEDHDRMTEVLQTALLLARQFDSYIEGIPLGPDLAEMVAADFSMSGVIFDDRTRREFLRHARETFEGFMAAGGIPRRSDDAKGLTFGWNGETLVSPNSVGEYGRVFDILTVGRPGPASNEPHRATLEAALFESGRPILIAPPKAPPTLGTVTAIFWNGSSETARSVAFAMPLLLKARDVVVLAVPGVRWPGPSDAQLARSLRRHGIPARVVELKPGKAPGLALLDKAAMLGADLLIKGGYTQSRLRQMIFGSVTSEILAEATLPVFMAH